MTTQGVDEKVSRNRALVLLRYALIIAMAYLLLVEHESSSLPIGLILVLAIAVMSNVAITWLPTHITDSTAFNASIIVGDTAWITGTLLYSGLFHPEFFYLYFFVLFLAAIGENLGLIAVGAVLVCTGYIALLSATGHTASLWTSQVLIRIPILFTAALFYGYLVDGTRRERHHAHQKTLRVEHLEEVRQQLADHAQQLERANDELAREITERNRVEGALQAAKDYAENLIGSSLDMIIAVDVHRNIAEFNRAAEETFGYRKTDVVGKPADCLYADLSECAQVSTSLSKHGRFIGEIANKRKNGEIFHSYVSASVMRDGDGEILGQMGISRDITEQKRAEEALRWLEKAVETMDLGVTISDTQGKIVYTNPADASMHGYAVAELIGQDARIFAPPQRWKRMDLQQIQHMETWTRESVNIRKDGSTFPVQLMSGAVTNAVGKPIGIVTLCEDITERKRVEKELKTMQLQLIQSAKFESVGQLAAGIAHEVKNPLQIIQQGLAYLARARGEPDDDNVPLVFEKMHNAVKRADRVILGLLDFSASSAIALTLADLNAVVEASVLLVKHEMVRAHVTMVKELGEGLPLITLDRQKIEQVFVNLFMNAVHAMPGGGTLTVRTYARSLTEFDHVGRRKTDQSRIGETIVVAEVNDTGTGIHDDKLDRVFDPFFTTKPIGQGTGLGLSVTRNIIELHEGTIDIRNRPEGGVQVTLKFRTDRGHEDAEETKSQPERVSTI